MYRAIRSILYRDNNSFQVYCDIFKKIDDASIAMQMAKKAKNVKRARRASMRYTGGYAEPENGGFQTLDAAAQRYSLYKT
ncbi:Hypothetical predicted protein [Octopus vulgaris]|uniref:Uncharacterized protein n=1 Tax=Octopus vulgaris TaxID=6645 RepID=A0AA36AGQ0_OCTVU|nr:Hypothetical predicted protein [Octopus vulgaris]